MHIYLIGGYLRLDLYIERRGDTMVQEEKNTGKAADEKNVRSFMIDIIPDELLGKLSDKGIASESIRLAVRSDMNAERVHCDNWLIVTDSDLICVGGTRMLTPKPGRKITDTRRLQVEFGEISYDYYPLEELSEFKVEEMISTAWLTANRTVKDRPEESGSVMITYMTNTAKSKMHTFVNCPITFTCEFHLIIARSQFNVAWCATNVFTINIEAGCGWIRGKPKPCYIH